MRSASIGCLVLAMILWLAGACGPMRAEERPLPLASNYNTGQTEDGFAPQWQMEMIEKGHHLILTIHFPGPEAKWDEWAQKYFGDVMKKAAQKRLPLSMVTGEWEAALYGDQKYVNLPAEENPCWVDLEGKAQKSVSPFGPVKVWSFAYVIGKSPEREWVVYANAPQGAKVNVRVTLPGYGEIRLDAPQSGSYYHVVETAGKVTPIVLGGPASASIGLKSRF